MRERLLPAVAVLAAVFAAGCATPRAYEAALVLADTAAGDRPSGLKRRTPPPLRTAVRFPVGGRSYAGDLYQSPRGPRAAIVLVPGVAERGKDDPRLVALATSLARARFTVLVPDLPGLREHQIHAANVQEARAAFAWLRAQEHLVPEGRAGFGGISYAAGPALLAALEPEIRDEVRFILTVGGYHSLVRVLTFLTTGHYRKGGRWVRGAPRRAGKWVFILSTSQRLREARDREVLDAMARRRIADPGADLADLAASLGPEGRRVFEFVTNRDPDRTPGLLDALPPEMRADIEALDPARRDLSELKARLILVHGVDDNTIPYTESVSLARALPRRQARLFLVRGLFHVDLEPGLRDKLGLVRALDALLAERRRL